MSIEVLRPPRCDVEAGLTRYSELLWSDGAMFEDTALPDGKAQIANVIGCMPPDDFPSLGAEDLPVVNRPIGFGVMYTRARPGHGAAAHAHDVAESLIPLTGRWRVEWWDEEGHVEQVLGPFDSITAPVGVEVAFHCETAGDGSEHGMILSIIASDSPRIRYSDETVERMRELGILDPD